jgi:hypothetical protein
VCHSFAYVVHFVFLRVVWIRTQRAAAAKQACYQLSHLSPWKIGTVSFLSVWSLISRGRFVMETVCPETLKFVKERLFHYSCRFTLLQCTKLLETFFTNKCVDNYLVNIAERLLFEMYIYMFSSERQIDRKVRTSQQVYV